MSEPSLVDDTLRRASVICMSFAASIGLYALLIFLLVERQGGRPWSETPGTGPFLMALGALLLIFISGAARARILRSALEAWEDGGRQAGPSELAEAFFRATLVCFAMAEAAALLGLVSAWVSRFSFYGFVICAASLYVMIARWPRRTAFEAFVDGDSREDGR
jgi:F0F1-type ATP synthase membrane subunit c/vacuolar-type H+-ATPase subunit K